MMYQLVHNSFAFKLCAASILTFQYIAIKLWNKYFRIDVEIHTIQLRVKLIVDQHLVDFECTEK